MKKGFFKKCLAASLAAVMVLGTAACGQQNEKTSEASKSSAQESSASASSGTEASTEVVENKYPEYLNLDGHFPIVAEDEEITLSMLVRNGTVETDPEERWFYHFIEQKLNIDLEVDGNLTGEKRGLILNSGDLPDLIWRGLFTPSELVIYGQEGGLFLDFSQYINEELTPNIVAAMEKYPEAFEKFRTPDGALYTMPKINYNIAAQGNERVFIDSAYMKAAGITETPETLDEFIDMLREFKKLDPDVMGVEEIIPWLGAGRQYPDMYIMSAFGWSCKDYGKIAYPCWDEAEQEIVIPCLQDKFKDYVKVWRTLYEEGLVHVDYFTISVEQARALSASGQAAVLSDAQVENSQNERVDEFIVMKPLTSQWTDKPVCAYLNGDGVTTAVVASADTEHPEVIMRLLDYLYTPEGSLYASEGPLDGSEDTLGMISGVINNNGVIDNKIVLEGEINSYNYRKKYVRLDDDMILNFTDATNMSYERLGLSRPSTTEEYTKLAEAATPDDPDYYNYVRFLASNPYKVYPLTDPFTTEEQAARLTDLTTVMETYVDQEFAKFVVGERPLEELDAFMEEVRALDSEELMSLALEVFKR